MAKPKSRIIGYMAQNLTVLRIVFFWTANLRNGPADQYPFCMYATTVQLGETKQIVWGVIRVRKLGIS